MKRFILYPLSIFFLLFIFSCSEDANFDSQSDSGQGGSLARFAIVDTTMYFVDNSEIKVYDISDPKTPTLAGTSSVWTNNVETVFHYGDYLYLGSSNGMYIYNIEQRHSPQYMSQATHASGCDPVVSDGKYAYVTVRNSMECNRVSEVNILEIYDVQEPTYPQHLSTTFLTEPIGLAIDGDTLFVCDDELKVFDVSDRTNPQLIKSFPSDAYDIIINGNVILTVDPKGINQYIYDRDELELTHSSFINTAI